MLKYSPNPTVNEFICSVLYDLLIDLSQIPARCKDVSRQSRVPYGLNSSQVSARQMEILLICHRKVTLIVQFVTHFINVTFDNPERGKFLRRRVNGELSRKNPNSVKLPSDIDSVEKIVALSQPKQQYESNDEFSQRHNHLYQAILKVVIAAVVSNVSMESISPKIIEKKAGRLVNEIAELIVT